MRDPRGLVDRVEVPDLNGVHFEAFGKRIGTLLPRYGRKRDPSDRRELCRIRIGCSGRPELRQ